MNNSSNLVARPFSSVGYIPRWVDSVGYGQRNLAGARIGEINWTTIFQDLIKQGFSTFAAQKEADRQYQIALANAQKEAADKDADSDDKTKMYLLVGGAIALALFLSQGRK